jgi:CheY-like chemotaxis protein
VSGARVVALVDDLIFASRIRVEAENAGATLERVGSTSRLVEAVTRERPSLVIVDLDGMGFDGVTSVGALRADAVGDGVRIIAFGSHVDVERLEAARAAGCDAAMARSQFVRDLAGIIREAGADPAAGG